MTELKYTLTKEEVKSALYLNGRLRPYRKKSIIQASITAVIFIIYFISVINSPAYQVGYLILALLILVIAAVFILPRINENRAVCASTSNAQTDLTLKDDKITVFVPVNNVQWVIESEMVANVLDNEQIYSINLKDNRAVIIPRRAVTSDAAQNELNLLIKLFLE